MQICQLCGFPVDPCRDVATIAALIFPLVGWDQEIPDLHAHFLPFASSNCRGVVNSQIFLRARDREVIEFAGRLFAAMIQAQDAPLQLSE